RLSSPATLSWPYSAPRSPRPINVRVRARQPSPSSNAPRRSPTGPHPARACAAALAIVERTEALATGTRPGPRFHIGINSGPALVGNIGSDAYQNFTAIGDTTNLAARLGGVAKAGEVVIGPLTAAALAGRFQLSPLGPVTVKGRVEPTQAYALRPA